MRETGAWNRICKLYGWPQKFVRNVSSGRLSPETGGIHPDRTQPSRA
jgi:hypothetical protein